MKHTAIAQASPHIAENETLGAKMGKSIMGKEERWDFDVLTYLYLGRNMMSGGVYGKYRINAMENMLIGIRFNSFITRKELPDVLPRKFT